MSDPGSATCYISIEDEFVGEIIHVLSPDLQLSGAIGQAGITQSSTLTLGGVVVQSLDKPVGQEFELHADLRGKKMYGFFTRATADFLVNLRDNRTVFSLRHSSLTLKAVYIPVNGINLSPWLAEETVEQEDGERLHGSVKIIKVG